MQIGLLLLAAVGILGRAGVNVRVMVNSGGGVNDGVAVDVA